MTRRTLSSIVAVALLAPDAMKVSVRPPLLPEIDKHFRRLDAQIRKGLEDRAMGLRFEMVDDGGEAVEPQSRLVSLVVQGALVFLLAVPIVAMGLGAFDARVLDVDDLVRLGLAPLGTVPAFAGDGVGSLASRRQRQRKQRRRTTQRAGQRTEGRG